MNLFDRAIFDDAIFDVGGGGFIARGARGSIGTAPSPRIALGVPVAPAALTRSQPSAGIGTPQASGSIASGSAPAVEID